MYKCARAQVLLSTETATAVMTLSNFASVTCVLICLFLLQMS